MPKPIQVHGGRQFDRLINFTDGIVAVAITVLVLPIVGLRAKAGESTVWQILSDNIGQISSFLLTFVVVALMWQVHNRIFSRLAGFDDTIFWLNLLWLVLIAILPWSSSLYGSGIDSFNVNESTSTWFSGGEGLGGTGLFYWLNLGLISLVSGLITLHARRNPILIDPQAPRVFVDTRFVRSRGFIFGAYMVLIGLLTLVIPSIAVWLPFGLFVIGFVLRRQEA
jgi:uncharacterized membrane protein